MIHSFPTRGQTIHLYLSKLEIRSQKFFNSHTKRRRQKKRQDKLFSIEKNRIPRQCILRNKRWAARDVRMKIKDTSLRLRWSVRVVASCAKKRVNFFMNGSLHKIETFQWSRRTHHKLWQQEGNTSFILQFIRRP